MEHETELHRVICALIAKQRRIAVSTNLAERLPSLWIATALNNRLTRCSDREVGELLILVQDQFHILEPEFAVCEHARRRLMLPTREDLQK